jgi:hypothetical protein
MRKRAITLCALVVVLFAMLSAIAAATADHWFSGTLANGTGFASTDAHSIEYIEGTGNHGGFCIAKDQGTAGDGPSSHPTTGTQSCAPSSGFISRTENATCCYHGWIDNPTGTGMTIDPSTHYSY